MDYGPGYLIVVMLWFLWELVWSYYTEPEEWEPHPITRPQVNSGSEPDTFAWAMMQNQRGGE